MDAKEYLHQAYRLDERIDLDMAELERLRQMSVSVASPQFGERVPGTRDNSDAAFVRCLEKIQELEDEVNEEVELMIALREQIQETINGIDNVDERMILWYRYLHNMSWTQIGNRIHVGSSTVRRWHDSALEEIVLPKNPIFLKDPHLHQGGSHRLIY